MRDLCLRESLSPTFLIKALIFLVGEIVMCGSNDSKDVTKRSAIKNRKQMTVCGFLV